MARGSKGLFRGHSQDVVVFGDVDWATFSYQTQRIALEMARRGHRVFYVDRTLQQWPRPTHLLQRLPRSGAKIASTPPPEGIRVLTFLWPPPHRYLRPLNRLLVARSFRGLGILDPLVITYCPSSNILDALEVLKPSYTVYINVHNYDEDRVLPDLLDSERVLAAKADLLMADSRYHRERLHRLSGGRPVSLSLAGVDFQAFRPKRRPIPGKPPRRLGYFGGIGAHLDLSLYNDLAKDLEVTFIGSVDPSVRRDLSPSIRLLPPVPNRDLPSFLSSMDALTYFRAPGEFSKGVLPAKFFECMATGLPFLYSGLPEVSVHDRLVHDVKGSPERARAVLRSLSRTETPARVSARIALGRSADWGRRMREFVSQLPQGTGRGRDR